MSSHHQWFLGHLGYSTTQDEISKLEKLIPSGYYSNSLQVGLPWLNYLANVEIANRYVAFDQSDFSETNNPAKDCHLVYSRSEALPFPEKSQNLIVLPHTLDFCQDPHEVLRQTNQILVSEGCMAIIGFNQLSLYGVLGFIKRKSEIPWSGKFYRVGRIQDWMALLGYDLVGAGMINYKLPIESEKWREKFDFLERAGNRWWPGLGGIYILVCKKREMGITPLPNTSRRWHQFLPGIAQPASQRAARVRLRLVSKN